MGKKRIKYFVLLLSVLLVSVCAGCGSEKDEIKGSYLVYLNTGGTTLTWCEYEIKEKDPLDAVSAMIKELKEPSESIDMKSAIPSDVKVEDAELNNTQLTLYFNHNYLEQDKLTEVLCRAAIVQSVTQIKGVETVEFYVGNSPLKQKSGEEVGPMTADSFVKNTANALDSSHHAELTLYFANEKGDRLIEEKVEKDYLGNISTEKLILDQLLKGPEKSGLKPLLSSETKVLNVSVKEGICYVNFNKHFLDLQYGVEPKVIIYGIVNSLVDSGNINKVQILVEGESTAIFQNSVHLNEPFDRNLELIQK